MKKSLSIIAVFTLAFFKAGCSYAGSDSTADVTVNIPVLDSYEGFKLQDKDGKRTDGAVNNADYIRNGNTYTVYASDNYGAEDSSGKSVANIITNMTKGDTLVFDGSKGIFYFVSSNSKRIPSKIKWLKLRHLIIGFADLFFYNLIY